MYKRQVEVDVTPLLAFVRAEKLKFYPAMMWAVGRVLNAHAEFKYSLDAEGALIQWDFISPYYADFHPDSEEFVKPVSYTHLDVYKRQNPR